MVLQSIQLYRAIRPAIGKRKPRMKMWKSTSEVYRFGKTMLLDAPLCDFGPNAPDFKLNSFDKKLYSRDELVGAKGFLIAFICNHCPYVKVIITNLRFRRQKIATNRHSDC